MRSRWQILSLAIVLAAAALSVQPAQAQATHTALSELTPDEASRPAELWTLEQVEEKGWTPYDCFGSTPLAPMGRRWPANDGPPNTGTCVTYSFMADGLTMETALPLEGPSAWFSLMPIGSSAAVTAATATWAAAADIHFTLITDGGGPFNTGGPGGLNGNLRVAAGAIPTPNVLAHAYFPPPNGTSAAGDTHFDYAWAWSTGPIALGPPFDIETVALHELGHALGLSHAGTFPGDIMFPTYSGLQRTLSAGDIAFMTSIYGPAGHPSHCLGACCNGPRACADLSQGDCANQGWTWRGLGTRCPTQNTATANHSGVTVVHWTDPAVNCLTSPLPLSGQSGCETLASFEPGAVGDVGEGGEDAECNAEAGEGAPCNCCEQEIGDPGCVDCPDCEQTVCGMDDFCCFVSWDFQCNILAQDVCTCCPGQDPGVCEADNGGCNPAVKIDSWMSSEDDTTLTCHQFGLHPSSPPIPADFFEPGSDPFQGEVCLIGEPVGPTLFGEYGEADTLILRSADPFDRCELPSADVRTVDIEIVELNLRSIQPIEVMVAGQPTFWDVVVDLSQFVDPPPGQLTATKEHCNGGTYNSALNVQPRFTFVKGGGPGVPPGTTQILDTGLEGMPFVQLFQEENPPWSNDLDPYLNLASGGPRCTGFHPGVEDPVQSNSCDCNTNGARDKCDIESGSSPDCNANGIPDECDPDSDGDGIPDGCDTCPDHPGTGSECAGTPGEVVQILVAKTGPPGVMDVIWGVPACSSADHNLYFGPLGAVSSYGYSGQACGVGSLTQHGPFNPGLGSFFFVVTGTDGMGFEGSYGTDSSSVERPTSPACVMTQDLSLRCD